MQISLEIGTLTRYHTSTRMPSHVVIAVHDVVGKRVAKKANSDSFIIKDI